MSVICVNIDSSELLIFIFIALSIIVAVFLFAIVVIVRVLFLQSKYWLTPGLNSHEENALYLL